MDKICISIFSKNKSISSIMEKLCYSSVHLIFHLLSLRTPFRTCLRWMIHTQQAEYLCRFIFFATKIIIKNRIHTFTSFTITTLWYYIFHAFLQSKKSAYRMTNFQILYHTFTENPLLFKYATADFSRLPLLIVLSIVSFHTCGL